MAKTSLLKNDQGVAKAAPLSCAAQAAEKMRVDKWLWQTRFFKSRSLAQACVTGGHLRVNQAKVSKSSHAVGIGDVLTFAKGAQVFVVEITSLPKRRGPAPEAQACFVDLSPKPATDVPKVESRVGGRPTGKARRETERLKAAHWLE